MGEVLTVPTEAVIMRRSDLDAILQTLVSLQAVSARAAALLCDRLDLHDAVLDPDSPGFASISDGMPGDPADHEPGGDEESAAWIEWHTMRGSQKCGPNLTAGHEDDEEDDPAGQCDEDGINTCLDVLQCGWARLRDRRPGLRARRARGRVALISRL
jgi:hypothetical protein